MSIQIVDTGNLSPAQLDMIMPLLTTASSTSVRLHFGLSIAQPAAHAVTLRKPGKRPQDQSLQAVFDSAPRPGPHFIIAIRYDVASEDARLIITLGHELEHVRQEERWPGLLELGNLALDFVRGNHQAFPGLPCELFVAVNLHAEARGARQAKRLVGRHTVEAHYAGRGYLLGKLDRTDPDAAASDLAAFLSANWSLFESWYRSAIRPTKPSLEYAMRFVEQHRKPRASFC